MPEQPLTRAAVYSARPVIRVNGAENDRVSTLLLAMEMTEQDGGLSSLELRFSNWVSQSAAGADFAFEDERVLSLGARIAVSAGERNSPVEIFRGWITGIEADFPDSGPPELVVLAEDALQKARMARRTAVHANASIGGLASDIASRTGLTANVTGFNGTIGTEVQLNETDLAFLRRVVQKHGGDLQVEGDQLRIEPVGNRRRNAVTLQFHSRLRRVRVLADLAHQATEITVGGWDFVQGSRVSGRGSGAQLGPGRGRTGAEVLRQCSLDRPEHNTSLAVVTNTEAQAVADADFDQRARRFVTLDATAEGDPSIRVGTHVAITGLSKRFNNTYAVTRATHRFNLEHGYETDFEAQCAYLERP